VLKITIDGYGLVVYLAQARKTKMKTSETSPSFEESELEGFRGDPQTVALRKLENQIKSQELHHRALQLAEAAALGAVCLTAGVMAGRHVFGGGRPPLPEIA